MTITQVSILLLRYQFVPLLLLLTPFAVLPLGLKVDGKVIVYLHSVHLFGVRIACFPRKPPS